MAMLQRERDKEENKEEIKEKEKDIEELEAEAERLVESIAKKTEKIKEKVKIQKQSKVKSTTVKESTIIKPEKSVKHEKIKIKQKVIEEKITEKTIIKKLIQTYKWAYKENLYPWMYFLPEKKKNKDAWQEEVDSWANEWANFLFDWAKEFLFHIVDSYELHTKRPFNVLEDREDALRIIMEHLADDSKLAEWLNDEKTRLRIYWRSLERWGEILFDWAYLVGEQRLTLLDLREMGKDIATGFDTLPAKDLREIVNILVKKKKASWINKRSFKLDFDI